MFISSRSSFAEIYDYVFSFVYEMSLHNDAGMYDKCFFVALPNNYYAVLMEGDDTVKYGKVLFEGCNLYDLFCKGLKFYKDNRKMWYIFFECIWQEARNEISNIMKFLVINLGYDEHKLLDIQRRTIREFVRLYDEEAWLYGK